MWYCPPQRKGFLFQRLRNGRAAANKRAKAKQGEESTDLISTNDVNIDQPSENQLKLFFKHCLSNDPSLKEKLAQTIEIRRQWLKDGVVIANIFGFFYADPSELVSDFFDIYC